MYTKENRKITTYREMHQSMECPVCHEDLIEDLKHDDVSCSNPNCLFNIKHKFNNSRP